jgi:type IV pilus assembly protein PilO
MDKVKQWVALTVLASVAILAAGWFLVVSPKRVDAAAIRDEAAAKQASNSTLQTQLAMLKAQAKDLPRQQARLAAVAARIPDNPALPTLIRALSKAAAETSVELISIAPAAPAAYTAPGAAATTTTTGTAGTTAATATPLEAIGVTINVNGGYFQVEQFLDRLEGLARALKVTGFTLSPGDNPVKPTTTTSGPTAVDTGKSLVGVITGQVFMQNPLAATATGSTSRATTATTTAR